MKITDLVPWRRGESVPVRRSGAAPARELQLDLNRAFDDFWRWIEAPGFGGNGEFSSVSLPRVDLRESEGEVEVVAELPGMDESDVDVSIDEGALVIRGERKAEQDREERGYTLRERSYGRVERVVPLPDGFDPDSARATFKNGVLTVKLAKTPAAEAPPKRIAVRGK
ncbi:MAG TPA: Hsp20/alpha crystallin family protein [Myxococcota bacterium]|nr:Hsp20/alpha crystallin family protein [Myxococcota bacterium]